MKKLIAVLTLFLAFGFSANAQESKKMTADESAKMDAVQLSEAVGLKGTQQDDFVRLFMMKYNMMNNPEATPEKKKEMTRVVDAKIRASLTPEQIQILDSKPELMAKLTGSASVANPKK